jgi:hypothetical protein
LDGDVDEDDEDEEDMDAIKGGSKKRFQSIRKNQVDRMERVSKSLGSILCR